MAVPLILDQMQMVDQVDLVAVQELNNQEWLEAMVTHLLLVLLKEMIVVVELVDHLTLVAVEVALRQQVVLLLGQ